MINILLIDDSLADIKLITRALALMQDIKYTVTTLLDGEQALSYFKQVSKMPHLIILDLNMPKVDGKEVLQYLKSSKATRHIPVIVLTTSSSDIDINQSYDYGASAYVTKPFHLTDFTCAIQSLGSFWLSHVSYRR